MCGEKKQNKQKTKNKRKKTQNQNTHHNQKSHVENILQLHFKIAK